MDSTNQEEYVKKLEERLDELRKQRVKVDEANEKLKKKLETLSAHLDNLDVKYGKKEMESEDSEEFLTDTKKVVPATSSNPQE